MAQTGFPYVLTTGTGSGKSLSYLVPIVDRVLRQGTGQGIRAIVVYPMNALANSQLGELDKFLGLGGCVYECWQSLVTSRGPLRERISADRSRSERATGANRQDP